MDTNTVATIPTTPNLLQRFAELERPKRMRLAVGVVLFVVIVIVGVIMGRQTEWRTLYASLSDKDGGAVIAQLSAMNVPYKYSEGGGAILVPADKVHEVRLKLASQGLPKGSVSGFEMLESNRFGMTQFQERLTFQRGLEGELTRSIQSMAAVESARVHLAIPNQNGFFREQQKPSASVLIGLKRGYFLDRNQIAGIIHLVSSSVPELSPDAVSVLDDSGKLLSQKPDASGVDEERLQYVQQVEQLYNKRILDILEPVLGKENVRAQVTADLDFSQTESTTESHNPNQTPDTAAVRSQQIVESGSGAQPTPPTGIPGATTNQPPAQSAAPINGQAQTLAATGQAAGGANSTSKKESITNYEVDKTVKVVRGASGVIKRITAAVVVNHQPVTNAEGKTTNEPLSDAQLEKLTTLVREAVGYSQDRGDSVNVINAAFAPEKPVEALPMWQKPEMLELAKNSAWPLGTLALAALVLFGVVRPVMKAMFKPVETTSSAELAEVLQGGQLDALEAEQPDRPALTNGASYEEMSAEMSEAEKRLNEARQLTRDNPAAVANIVKAWINGEDAPATA
ncbi:flagellar M-ring protein FliF [Curvibacter sp. CHRR-16]|uniref:flagellar basal-body MS-ring/collar protein FliF n=1 Tax=Curvibacter sp. CHRR-16 TaxID=2835872 RepID=UPI001BDACF56|nr:flagellar basal-body MS-ring/collar protein FliF [Curvibacter sp. CHRR-16]MBT0569524.1 flagellar M-ring protein FliF [Curvibacter sp. CHRR-16]